MKTLKSALLLAVVLPFSANSALIELTPSSSQISVGETATFDLRVSNLGDDFLAAFRIYIGYDWNILDATGFDFSPDLSAQNVADHTNFNDFNNGVGLDGAPGDPDDHRFYLDISTYISIEDANPSVPLPQSDGFNLGTLTLEGWDSGVSTLILGGSLWGWSDSELLAGLDPDTYYPRALPVEFGDAPTVHVPEPGAFTLLAIGLVGFGLQRKIRQEYEA